MDTPWPTTLAEDVFLMGAGHIEGVNNPPTQNSDFGFGGFHSDLVVPGAIVAELLLGGVVELIHDDRIVMRGSYSGRERLLREAATRLAGHGSIKRFRDGTFRKAGMPLHQAILDIARDTHARVLARLEARELAELEEKRRFLVRATWATVDGDARAVRFAAVRAARTDPPASRRVAHLAALGGFEVAGDTNLSIAFAVRRGIAKAKRQRESDERSQDRDMDRM